MGRLQWGDGGDVTPVSGFVRLFSCVPVLSIKSCEIYLSVKYIFKYYIFFDIIFRVYLYFV